MTNDIQNIPFGDLRASPLNTRKTFNGEGIERLADSIASQGIQQNLVARRVMDVQASNLNQFYYELVAGERRLRAFAFLVERGDRAATDTLPVRVVTCDDTQLLELNLIENLQRDDLHPLDEAEGYAALIEAGRDVKHIAEMVPFTERHVQLRLQLAANLGGEAKTAFRAGDLSLAQARIMAAYARAESQASVIQRIADNPNWYGTAEDLKEELLDDEEGYIPVEAAFFERILYTGEIIQDPDDPEVEYFADTEEFKRLQSAAVLSASTELRRQWAWAEISRGSYFKSYDYDKSEDKNKAGAIVFVDENDHKVTIHTGLLKRGRGAAPVTATTMKSATPATKGKRPAPPAPDAYLPTRAGLTIACTAKTQALRAAIVGTGARPAMMAVILALMDARVDIHLRRFEGTPTDENILSPAVTAVMNKYRPRFKGLLCNSRAGGGMEMSYGKSAAKVFETLNGFTDAEIEELFTALVASTVGSYPGYAANLGDNPVALGLAQSCAADVTQHWQIDEEYLAACRKLPLQRIAASIGAAVAANAKAMDMRTAILAHLKANPDAATFLPAPFHFGSRAELMALAGAQKAKPAEQAKKAGKKTNGTTPAKKAGKRLKPNGRSLGERAKIKSPAKTKEAKKKFAKKHADDRKPVTRGVMA